MTEPMPALEELLDDNDQLYSHSVNGDDSLELVTGALADAIIAGPVVVSWCDGLGSRMTILFAIPTVVGMAPGLNLDEQWLTVAIEGYGTYSFAIKDEEIAWPYIGEKLMNGRYNPTTERLADLVGTVRMKLARHGA